MGLRKRTVRYNRNFVISVIDAFSFTEHNDQLHEVGLASIANQIRTFLLKITARENKSTFRLQKFRRQSIKGMFVLEKD